MRRYACARNVVRTLLALVLFLTCESGVRAVPASADETFVIAASPSLREVLERLGDGFERSHAGVNVRLFFDTGLSLRQTIAGMENSMVGRYFIGTGPISLVAPGGDELITRLKESITSCRTRSGPMPPINWCSWCRNLWWKRRHRSTRSAGGRTAGGC